MKRKLISLLVPVLLFGCATPFGSAMLTAASNLSGLAAEWAVVQYPEKRPQFESATAGLTAWLETGKTNGVPLDAATLTAILANVGLGQAGWGDNGELYIQGALLVWNLAAGVNYQITSKQAVQQIAGAIRDGFARGLAKSETARTRSLVAAGAAKALPKRLGKVHKL